MPRAFSLPVLGLVATAALVSAQGVMAQSLYFPATQGAWEHVQPASVGWDADALSAALDVAGSRGSSGVVILQNGRILAERYWTLSEPSATYTRFLQGQDEAGRAIEDVASAQKSIVAVLTGIAVERGLLTLADPVSEHLGTGWSDASAEQERAITIRHLMSMTSGLTTDLGFAGPAGSRWLYNTPAYHQLMRAVVAAAGKDRNALTREWITEPLGMVHSEWTERPFADPSIAIGFSTTARELARFGLMIQAGGRWGSRTIVADPGYLTQMLTPSQSLNPAYGFLWWLNGQDSSLGTNARATLRSGHLIPSAPADLVAMQGALDRKLYLVPSLGLVVARLGDLSAADGESFNDAFWSALMRAKR